MPEEPKDDAYLLDYMEYRYAEAIGKVIVEMARLEAGLDGVIWALAELEDNEEVAACITAQLAGPRPRFDALLSLAKFRKTSPKGIGKIEKFQKVVTGLAERRNRVAHDTWHWGVDTKQHYQLELTARSSLRFFYKPVSEADLEKLKTDIIAAREQFREVFHEALVTVKPWREKL